MTDPAVPSVLTNLRAMSTADVAHVAQAAAARFAAENPASDDVWALAVAVERLAASVIEKDVAARTTPSATTTVEHAKIWARAHMSEGVDCPVCTRDVKMYRRRLTPAMASAVRTSYLHHGTEWHRTAPLWSRAEDADGQKLRYWGLVVPERDKATNPNGRTGIWRVTDLGVEWLAGRVTVPSHALVFDSRCFGLEGESLSFIEALNDDGFNLEELMSERPFPPPSDTTPQLFHPEAF